MSDDAILAALARLETGQTQLRIDLMARMDRLQDKLGVLDEHLTMGLGNADRVEEKSDGVVKQNRILSQQMLSVQKLLRMLEARVNALEERR